MERIEFDDEPLTPEEIRNSDAAWKAYVSGKKDEFVSLDDVMRKRLGHQSGADTL